MISDVILKIRRLSDELAEHTLLILMFPDNESVNHWRNEILNFLERMKISNRIKSPSRKLSIKVIYDTIYDSCFEDSHEIELMIQRAYCHVYQDSTEKSANISEFEKYDFEFSLPYIYDDYVSFIDGKMSKNELIDRISNFYVVKKNRFEDYR